MNTRIDNFTFEFFREKLEKIQVAVDHIKKQGEHTMSQIDDLKQANTDLKTAVGDVGTKQAEAFKRLEDLIASGASSTEVQAVIDDMKVSTQVLKDLAAKDEAEGQPAPTPAP